MDGDVGAALFQCQLELLDEQALAADLAQAAVENLVAAGRHSQQGNHVTALLEQCLDMLRLPQRQAAFAGGDDQLAQSTAPAGFEWRGPMLAWALPFI